MQSTLAFLRLALSAIALVVVGYLYLSGTPLAAEDPGPGCEYGEPTGDFRCTTAMRHIYAQVCEGNDCYYMLETCCALAET